MKSPAAYEALGGLLNFHSTRNFIKYSPPYLNTLSKCDDNKKYLTEQFKKKLKRNKDKIISLKYEEVGHAENKPDELASHVQAFMIGSLFSKYKEVVRLIPVHRQDTQFLYKLYRMS